MECGIQALYRLLGGNIRQKISIKETQTNIPFLVQTNKYFHTFLGPYVGQLIIAIANLAAYEVVVDFEKCIQLQLVCHMSATADVALPAIKPHFFGPISQAAFRPWHDTAVAHPSIVREQGGQFWKLREERCRRGRSTVSHVQLGWS